MQRKGGQMTDREEIEALKEENAILHSCLEDIDAFRKEQHDIALKVGKEIVKRDRKAVANIILNMRFGNMDNVTFCEIFDLKSADGCNENKRCTDCIHAFLERYFAEHVPKAAGEKNCCMGAIQRILQEIDQKQDIGYAAEQLEVDYGYIEDEENEGYYLSKLNGWGATPITEILAKEGELDETELIKELDKRKIAHCLR